MPFLLKNFRNEFFLTGIQNVTMPTDSRLPLELLVSIGRNLLWKDLVDHNREIF